MPPRRSMRASAGSAWTSTRTPTRCRSACSSCGWAIGGPVRRRRRRPDDLHVHRRHERVPDRVRGPAPGRGSSNSPRTTDPARRSSPWPTTCSPRPGATSDSWRPSRPARSRWSPATGPRRRNSPRWRAGSASGSAMAPRPPRSRSSSGSTPSSPRSRPPSRGPASRTRSAASASSTGRTSAERSTSSAAPGSTSTGPALAGGHPGAVGGEARLRRRHRGRPRRRGGPRADRGARHAARHPRHAGPLRRAASMPTAYLAQLDRRRAAERAGSADGVNLLTYHRAKGLEWDAVALPALEEGLLPIRQAFDDDELLAEEGRLLYVGITRARTPPVDLVGRRTRDPRPHDPARAESVPGRPPAAAASIASPSSPTDSPRTRARAGPPARRRPPIRTASPTTTRCSRRSVAGARPGPARTRSRRTSCSTTRPWPPSPTSSHRGPRRCGG